MEDVAHFMEEPDNITVKHQGRAVGSRFGKVCNYCSHRIHTLAIWKQVARAQAWAQNSCVTITDIFEC